MKRFYRLIAAIAVMTMVFSVTVFAEDRSATMISSESTDDLVRQLDAYNTKVMGQVLYVGNYNPMAAAYGSHSMVVSKQVKDYDILCCNNHKQYLANVLSAAQTDLINKQNQYNVCASQSSNPTYAALLPKAQAELTAAQNKVADTQNKIAYANQALAKYYDATAY